MFSCLKRGRTFYTGLVALALPIILQNLITNSLGLLDTFMVGMLGETPMAAVTLANIPIFVIQLMIFGFQSGASVLISQHWGKKDTDTINRVIGISFYVAGALSLLFALVMVLLPRQFMGLFSNNAELVEVAAQYARIVGPSYVFNSLTQVYLGAHRSMENPRLGLYVLAVSMCSNTLLNYMLIFGKFGAPALGVIGAAAATLSSRILEFIITFTYAFFSKRFRLRWSMVLRPGKEVTGRFIHYASPVVFNETMWGLGTSLFPTIMGHMEGSTEILAAFTIAGNIEKVATVVVFALAGASAIIIGREIGSGQSPDKVYDIGAALNVLSFLLGGVVGGIVIVLSLTLAPAFLYPLFHLSDAAGGITTMMLVVTFAIMPLRSFNSTNVVGVLRGGGDVRMASFIDLTPLWLAALPAAAVVGLAVRAGILPVYLALSLENVIKFFTGVRRFRSGVWIHDITQKSWQK
ncbi:MAG: MATE family efflux transporter [Oscillospiraceae bacterium]|nr:MATE family efflux transporter [Oscillospiraceae bacterium]